MQCVSVRTGVSDAGCNTTRAGDWKRQSYFPMTVDHCDVSANRMLAGDGAMEGVFKKSRRDIIPRQAERKVERAGRGSGRPSAIS